MKCKQTSIEQLVAHADGELDAREEETVARHVASCAACAREVDLLRRSGALVAGMTRLTPGAAFTRRVVAAARRAPAPPRGALRRLWPAAAAAAAVLLAAVAARVWLTAPSSADAGALLTAREEREIAADLYVLSNLDALRGAEAEELISLVEDLDILEGTEPEVSGLFPDDEDGG